jgi:hypothetical protein
MMAGVLSLQRHQPTRFQEACLFVKEVVEAAGDAEYGQAKSRCFTKGDGNKKVTDPFTTPIEDTLPLSYRSLFGSIIIADGHPGSEVTVL